VTAPPALMPQEQQAPAEPAHSAAPRLPLVSAPTPNPAGAAPVVPSAQLLGAHQAIEIEHNGQRYRLQSTRSGKLILTK
jgi:hemin uptake protein HemP